jgi:nicotinate-nucleotide--dimethylbenzimidazole phosphoribosyltransferase
MTTPDHTLLDQTISRIRGLDPDAMQAARQRQDCLTKPRGSLGVLEDISVQLAGLAGECPPPLPEPATIAVFAGDHGVHAQAVTPWPQEVTGQMVSNFLAGGAVINAIAADTGARVLVVDIGVAGELDPHPMLVSAKVRPGTADFTVEPAMTRDEAIRAIEVGIEVAHRLIGKGTRLLVTGDMGIANTTPSAALISALTSTAPELVTGRGTGVDDETMALKVATIKRGLQLHQPDVSDPVGVLAAVGGLEQAGLAGLILGASAARVPVLLDGVIAAAAALVAQALAPRSVTSMIAGHLSTEPGAAIALQQLGLRPLIELDLRLGEGSGGALAIGMVRSAVRILRDVASFDSAGVVDKEAANTEQLR